MKRTASRCESVAIMYALAGLRSSYVVTLGRPRPLAVIGAYPTLAEAREYARRKKAAELPAYDDLCVSVRAYSRVAPGESVEHFVLCGCYRSRVAGGRQRIVWVPARGDAT